MPGPDLRAMAWRNLWRNRRRTLITMSALVFGFFLAIIFQGLTDQSLGDAVDLAARLGAGHVTLERREYQETPSTKWTVTRVGELEKAARAQPGVVGVVHRIAGQTMLSTAGQSQAAQIIAYDPRAEDENTLPFLKNLSEKERLKDPAAPQIVLGSALAENLNTALGRKVVYTLTDRHGEIVTGLARVSGILKTGIQGVDANLCLLPIDTVRGALGYGPDEATFVAIFLSDHRKAPAVAAALSGAVGATETALTWRDVQPDLAAFIGMKMSGMVVMGVIMLLLTAAGIFNTLFVSVMERLREFGILSAIGFSPGRLFRLVIWESFWLGLVGIAAGIAFTALPYHYLATTGISMARMTDGKQVEVAGAAIAPILYTRIHPENAVVIVVVILLATLLSGVYPAWRAGRVVPVESIRLV